jgi:hypothetical protein
VLTTRGAMRVEPQFSDQSMIIPQGGTASLSGGQIESLQADASACTCDFPRAHMEAPKSVPPTSSHSLPSLDISTLAPPLPPQSKKIQNTPPPSAAAEEPVYTVLMPPLSFNANSPEAPAGPAPAPTPAPETILLVRRISWACEPRARAVRCGSRFAAGASPGRRSACGTSAGHLRPRKKLLPQADWQTPLRRRRLQQLERCHLS